MKILHLIDSAGLYGAERVLLHLAEEQQRNGLMPVIASIGATGEGVKPLEEAAVQRGIPVARFRMRPGPNFFGARKIREFALREKINLLHSHGYKGNILFGLMPAASRPAPLLTTLHGWTGTRRLSRLTLYEWLDRQALRRLDAVVVVYQGMRRHPWLAGRKLRLQVVANGIPMRAADREESPDPAIVDFCRGGFTVGAVGRLSPEKGFDRLIAAFASIVRQDRTARLVILGEGGERPALEALVRCRGLGRNIRLAGFREDAAAYLPYCDLFVLPSLTEGLPLSALEAMRAGVPVLSTRVGALPELLEEGLGGFLVDGADVHSLAEALDRIRRHPEEARRRAERARRTVRERYSSTRMAAEYAALYRQLARGKSR